MPSLNVPYFSQRDNKNHPGGTCNITSIAMVMAYWKIVGDGSGQQLEDQLYDYARSNRLVIGSPADMAKIFAWKKMEDRLNYSNKDWIQRVKKKIDEGKPVIVHAQFTPAGHIFPIVGYGNNKFLCHDPNGIFSGVYGQWTAVGGDTGKYVPYSYEMLDAYCNIGGTVWLHEDITRPGFTHL